MIDIDGERLLRATKTEPFVRAFEALRRAALTGPSAVSLIQRIAGELRA